MSDGVLRAVFAALTLMCTGTAAVAREHTVEVRVQTGDLDLDSEAGARAMIERLREAAVEACDNHEPGVGQLELWLRARMKACVREAMDAAVERLDAPLVTTLHENSRRQPRLAQEREDPRG